jgi:hypothetical protein
MPTTTTRTMTPAAYLALARKLHSTYVALAAAADNAEHFDVLDIVQAMDALAEVPDRLRIQVCSSCSKGGYRQSPDNPDASIRCTHECVARFNIRTGEVIA